VYKRQMHRLKKSFEHNCSLEDGCKDLRLTVITGAMPYYGKHSALGEEQTKLPVPKSKTALSRVRLLGQRFKRFKKLWGLADKESHVGQESGHSHGNAFWIRRTNDSTIG